MSQEIAHVNLIRKSPLEITKKATYLESVFMLYLSGKWEYTSKQTYQIQIHQPTRCNSFTGLLLDVYVWLIMFRATLHPSSGAYGCTRSLWFYRWSVAGRGLADHDQQRSNRHAPKVKPEAPSAVVRSWWWAERSPKHVEPHINVK